MTEGFRCVCGGGEGGNTQGLVTGSCIVSLQRAGGREKEWVKSVALSLRNNTAGLIPRLEERRGGRRDENGRKWGLWCVKLSLLENKENDKENEGIGYRGGDFSACGEVFSIGCIRIK